MAVDILLFLAGLIVAAVTLNDVFGTVIVPGASHWGRMAGLVSAAQTDCGR